MTDTDQRGSYASIVNEAVRSLESIGFSSTYAERLVKSSFDIFYQGAPISDSFIGEHKPFEARTILQSLVRPHAIFVKQCNVRRVELFNREHNGGTLSSEELREYAEAKEILDDYLGGAHPLPFKELGEFEKKVNDVLCDPFTEL